MEPLPAPSAKRSWPLLVLGACAFVPGFGIFFGAAAVTWGLVSDRPRAKLGVILGGAGALLNLVGGAMLIRRFGHTVEERTRSSENQDRKSTRLNSSHGYISHAVFCL